MENPPVPSQTQPPSEAAFRVSIDPRRFPWMRRLATDYAFDFSRLERFFAGDPANPEAWTEAIDRAEKHERPRGTIARVVVEQLRRRGAPENAAAAAQSLADPRVVAIVTGQQAGLFGGPLFTLLKALTTIQLARRVAREHGRSVVPVFWIDAEDHDWAEVASCAVLDRELQPKTISLSPDSRLAQAPIAAVQLDHKLTAAVEQLGQALERTEFTSAVLAQVGEAYQTGIGMAEAFGRWLESLLGPQGLVVFDGSDPAAKPFVADLFKREIESGGRTSKLALETGEELARLGYHMQVTPQLETVALFHLDGVRQPIRRSGPSQLTIEGVTREAGDLAKEAASQPAKFSPNVLMRPIVQDQLFPTVAYVPGPNELAYLGQLREVYRAFGVPMPLMYPRMSATLVDSATARFLSRYDLPFEALQPQDEAALNRLLQSTLPQTVEQSLKRAAEILKDTMEGLLPAVSSVDPTLTGAVRSTHARIEQELRTLHGKVIQAAKRRDQTLRRQFLHARALAFPHGHPQERAVGFIYFLNRYGPALIDRLMSELPLEIGQHWVVAI